MKNKKKNIILYVMLGVVILLACAAVLFLLNMKPKQLTAEDHINNGKSFAESGDYEKALSAYGMALDMEPDNIRIYIAMADIYDRMGDNDSLEGIYAKMTEILDNDRKLSKEAPEEAEDIYYRYADILMNTGRGEEAYRMLSGADGWIDGLLKYYKDDVFGKEAVFEYYDDKPVSAGEGQVYFGGYPCSEVPSEDLPVAVKAGEFKDDSITIDGCTYIRVSDDDGGYRYFRRENILWDIAAESDDGYILLSHNIIDSVSYSDTYSEVVWKDSYIREWLNNDFYNTAFSDEQKKCIVNMYVDAPINVHYGTGNGEPVYDNVAVPSLDEEMSPDFGYYGDVYTIFEERAARPTDYAGFNGAITENNGNGRWWLRTMGSNYLMAVYVSEDGALACGGEMVNAAGMGVRPMIIISKDAVEK